MKKFLFILLAALLFTPTTSMAAAEPRSSDLNSRVMVNGEVILLGDIFTNAGDKANQAVAYAPSAGQKAVFDAPWLERVATAFGINWTATSGFERTIVERNSEIIESSEIKAVLTRHLIENGVDPSSEIILSNKSMRLYTTAGVGGDLKVEDISHDPVSGRFSAKMLWQGENGSQQIRVSGRVNAISEIPVLARRILRGDNISKRDIRWIKVRSASLQRDTIIDHSDLIGMTAIRTIAASQPVRTSEIRRPLMVEKGSSVTIELTTPMMRLTIKGRALEHGSRGDIIRISNLQTKTVIEAEITGPGVARVSSSVNLAMK